MLSGSAVWALARSMVDSEAVWAVVPEVDLEDQDLEEEGRAAVVLAAVQAEVAEVGAGVVDAVAEEVEAEIKMGAAVLTTGSSRASVTGGVNSLRTRVRFLSRYRIRH
jgi:hypothetical protein